MSSETLSLFHDALSGVPAETRSVVYEIDHVATEETLLAETAKGSKDALGQLYDRLARHVYAVAARILRDEAEAEDLVHEVFLLIHRNASLFDPAKGSARTWIIHTAYTRALNRRGFLNVRHHYEAEERSEDRVRVSYIDPEQMSIDRMTAQRLMDRFHEVLSPDQRHTLEMHFFEGCTFREIAEENGTPIQTVRSHYYRACERLRALIPQQKDAQRD